MADVTLYLFTFEAEVVVSRDHELKPLPRTFEQAEGWNHLSADPIALLKRGRGDLVMEVRLERVIRAEDDIPALAEGRSLALGKLRDLGFATPNLEIHSRRISVEVYVDR